MAQAERADPAAGAARLAVLEGFLARGWRGPAAGAAVVAGLCFLTYLAIVGAIDGLHSDVAGEVELRHGAVISTLIGFVAVARLLIRPHLRDDVAALAPLLPAGSPVPLEGAPEFASTWLRAVALLGAVLGLVVAGTSFRSWPQLASAFDAHLAWSFTANMLLFAMIGQLAWFQRAGERFLDRTVTARLRVPLLDRAALAPYARRGLRGSLFWFLGSSIASLLFINWGFSWTVFSVMLCTLALGMFALLEPSRRLRRRIRQAKSEELATVRASIAEARGRALEAGEVAATAQLPGLLAWEARIAAVHEWPFDTTTWLRFGALAMVAVGSWLGGALVERVLGLALD